MLQFFLKKRLIITALAVGAALGTWIFLTCASRQTARFEFNVDDPARFAALELAAPAELYGWRLNDQPVPLPFEGMTYEKIPAIPSSLLVKGRNVLQAAVPLLPPLQAPSPEELEGEVFALEQKGSVFPVRVSGLTISSPCRFTIGPVLGSAGADFFTVACQTNMPVPVSLEVAGRILESPAGAAHCWRVDGLQPGAVYEYRLSAEHPLTGGSVTSGPYHVRTFDEGEDLLFAACGDSRSSPEIWARTAAFICSRKPALFIHTGDMVTEGFLYNAWPREMFDPAAELLSSVPAYPVIGNHEYNADIFQRLLQPPSGLQNWEQRIGPVQIIGIDGALDWSSGSARWPQFLPGIRACA
ncbi:MAG: metallophosphoesterase, partial [Pseudomonadota bacterium]